MAQLVEYGKKFIIIGNQNAITYKEIFPLLKDNKIWLGYGFKGGNAYFAIPNQETSRFANGVYNAETGLVKFRNCAWFTNLDIDKRHEQMILYKNYNSEEYPHYDNYDAIEVSKTADIPCDYDGVMGVPITFMDKYNPEQFEILGLSSYIGCDKLDFFHRVPDDIQKQLIGGNAWMPILHNKNRYQYSYRRIFIRKRG